MDATPRVTFASDADAPIDDGNRHRSPSPTVSVTPSLLQPHTPTPRGPNGRLVPPKLSVASTAHHAEQPDGAGGRFVVHGNGQVDHDESDGGHQSTRRYARIVRRGSSSSRGSSAAPTPGPSSRSSSVFDPRYDVAASPEAAGAVGGRRRIPAIALAPLSAMPQGYLSRSNLRSRSAGSSSHSKLAYGATPRSQLSSTRSRSAASTGARTPRTFVYADDTARARQFGGTPARRREDVEAAHWVTTSDLPVWLANACIAALVAVTWYAYDVVDALVSARAELSDMTRRALDAEEIVAHVRSQLPAPPAATVAAAAGDSGVTGGEIIVWVCIAVAAVAVTAPSRKVGSKAKRSSTTTSRRTHVYVGTGFNGDGIAADTGVVDPPTEPRLTSSKATVPAAAAGGDDQSPKPTATRKLFGRDGGDDKQPHEQAAAGGGEGMEHPPPSVLETPASRRTASGARRTDDDDDYSPAVRSPAAVPPMRTAREAVDDLLSHGPPADGSPSRSVARLSPRVQALIAARALEATPSPRCSSPTTEPSSAAKLDMAASP